jgi:hypothetical protein
LEETKSNNVYFPRPGKIEIIQNPEIEKILNNNYNSFHSLVLCSNNFTIPNKNEHDHTISDGMDTDLEITKNIKLPNKFQISKNENLDVNSKIVIEFNNHPLLKKINSSYHLRRKISTKLQKDIKNLINSLIREFGRNKCLPYMTSNSKKFRENVKIDTLKCYGELTIEKYICEEGLDKDNPNQLNNKTVIENIEKLYMSEEKNETIKKLYHLIKSTLVKDYFHEFLNSNRYKRSKEKDLEKYQMKLNNIFKNSEEKKIQFLKIYSMKYDDIAFNYFGKEN